MLGVRIVLMYCSSVGSTVGWWSQAPVWQQEPRCEMSDKTTPYAI